jgi:hypothetical protein
MTDIKHGPHCPQPYKGACLKFSTDGTRLGADIAHTFSTTNEQEIIEDEENGIPDANKHLTGMIAEQREWEGLDDPAEDGDEEGDGAF